MKLTMLLAECQASYSDRIDVAFRDLLGNLHTRLSWNKVIRNLAHPDRPAITRITADQNVIDLQTRIREALDQLETLDNSGAYSGADRAGAKSLTPVRVSGWVWLWPGASRQRQTRNREVCPRMTAMDANILISNPHRDFVSFSLKKTSLIISYEEDGKEHFAIVPLLTVTSAMAAA